MGRGVGVAGDICDGRQDSVTAVSEGRSWGKYPVIAGDADGTKNHLTTAVSDNHGEITIGGIEATVDHRAGVITDEIGVRATSVIGHGVDRDGNTVPIFINLGINHHILRGRIGVAR